jgi:hypothetical protein
MEEEKMVLLPEETLRQQALDAEDSEALFAVAGELYHLVGELRKEIDALEEEGPAFQSVPLPCPGCSETHQLACAVTDFADWQFRGYEGWKEDVRRDVGRQLWFEVSDLVRKATGDTPATPGFGSA